MTDSQEHHLDWNDRLQDWLDGDLEPAQAGELEAHLRSCALCQGRLEELRRLDEDLSVAAPRLALDESFDRRIFTQIESMDEARRAEARRRVEQELQQNLSALSRGWRRALSFVLPGVLAGIAIAFALITWLDDSGVTRALAMEGASELGRGISDVLQLSLTAVLGAVLGLVIARWLASIAE